MDTHPEGLSRDEFSVLVRHLESFHELFCALWKVGEPVFTLKIKTAAIVFDFKGAPLKFLFNPVFWRKLPAYDREFVVCHEMLHVVLNHGFRGLDLRSHELANVAADLVVNHILVNKFGFVRELLQNWQSLCWVDTVFSPEGSGIPATNLTMEEYYSLLRNGWQIQLGDLVDEHYFEPGPFGSLSNARAAREVEARLGALASSDAQDAIEKLGSDVQVVLSRGHHPLGAISKIKPERVTRVPWEDVIRARLLKRRQEERVPGWVFPSRRFEDSADMSPPGLMDPQVSSNDSLMRCAMFLDASGSTWGFRNRFFALAQSLPPKRYEVELCSFDTEIYPLDLRKPEMVGGGGTRFEAIEAWLIARERAPRTQKQPRRRRYPDAVIVITDGCGGHVRPKYPERWHWLLTMPYYDEIPKASARYLLRDFS